MKFKYIISESEIEEIISPGRPNKLLWVAKAVTSFSDNVQKHFGVTNILTYLESNVPIVEAFNKIIDGLRYKKKEKFDSLMREFKVF
jgi:hypothetical protein